VVLVEANAFVLIFSPPLASDKKLEIFKTTLLFATRLPSTSIAGDNNGTRNDQWSFSADESAE
jgi:hypothetical protein